MEPQSQQDKLLWRSAKKRAAFKITLTSYIFVNAFLVAIWYFTDTTYFWPKWPMLGWGIGLAFQYFEAYQSSNFFSVEKEYEKLKKENQS